MGKEAMNKWDRWTVLAVVAMCAATAITISTQWRDAWTHNQPLPGAAYHVLDQAKPVLPADAHGVDGQ